MAERRMFAKKITESDAFLDMPASTQALYFHLNMAADDDGFVNNPKKIQRMVGSSDDDFKLLIAKSFIITFDSGVIVIKHWKMHNYIQKDRYKPTDYIDERAMLDLKKNKAYTLDVSSVDTNCVQDVRVGKVREGKVSLGKDKDKVFFDDENLNRVFKDFMDMRKKIKSTMTDRAITLMVNKINKLDSSTAIKMLEQSVMNSWKDIYPLKEDFKKPKPSGNKFNNLESRDHNYDDLEKKLLGI